MTCKTIIYPRNKVVMNYFLFFPLNTCMKDLTSRVLGSLKQSTEQLANVKTNFLPSEMTPPRLLSYIFNLARAVRFTCWMTKLSFINITLKSSLITSIVAYLFASSYLLIKSSFLFWKCAQRKCKKNLLHEQKLNYKWIKIFLSISVLMVYCKKLKKEFWFFVPPTINVNADSTKPYVTYMWKDMTVIKAN